MARTRKGEDYVKRVFGGSLYQQGRGFYVALELFAILRGSVLLEQKEGEKEYVLPDDPKPAKFLRPTHDFARRLMAGWFESTDPEKREEHMDESTSDTLRALLIGLHAPVPGRRTAPARWRKWHLYPYPPDFIHYDALQRRGKISIERDSYRGGGGLAHRILRTDDNVERLVQTRNGFRQLLANSSSPLGALARALGELEDATKGREEPWEDQTEAQTEVRPSPWVEELRAGTSLILRREDIPDSKRIEALMHWVPYCILRHQQTLAYAELGVLDDTDQVYPTIFDCQPENNAIRDEARVAFQRSSSAIRNALEHAVREDPEVDEEIRTKLTEGSSKWMTGPRSFFTTTSYAVGAANANTGTRWFTIAPELLETIVLAKLEDPTPFDEFCELVLYEKLGMVVGRRAASREEIFAIDQSNFDRNTESLADTLDELGMLQRYSDMTRMVGAIR